MEEQVQSSWNDMLDNLAGWVDAAILNLPNLVLAILVFSVTYFLGRYVGKWMDRPLSKFIKQPSFRALISNVITIIIVSIGLLLALGIMNLDTVLKSLLAGAGVAGLAVGLALQGTLSNTFSGIYLAVKDIIKIGDWVETNDYAGSVHEITMRNTIIRTSDQNLVIIPNKMVLENPFKNYGLTPRIRNTVSCGVTYDSDLAFVRNVALEAVEEVFPPEQNEVTEFHYTGFGGSSIDFHLRFWIDAKARKTMLETRSDAIMAIKKAFDANDIGIPFPIRTLHVEDKSNIAEALDHVGVPTNHQ